MPFDLGFNYSGFPGLASTSDPNRRTWGQITEDINTTRIVPIPPPTTDTMGPNKAR